MMRSGSQAIILSIAAFNSGRCLENVRRMSRGIMPSGSTAPPALASHRHGQPRLTDTLPRRCTSFTIEAVRVDLSAAGALRETYEPIDTGNIRCHGRGTKP